ncbi:kanadaptin [Nephila pilipes]|uniref:Kanadaptin n=1 Tax=Nephila pilipes TaxID=299642 RepID=A0A8X6QFU8_NEPPI|nr:kanadaptin [Nephila pilipes]
MSEPIMSTEVFKVPLISTANCESLVENSKEQIDSASSVNKKESVSIVLDQASKKETEKHPIKVSAPYTEPEWSGTPPPNYYIEVIKNGTCVFSLPIKSPFIVFGRMDKCDIVFEHPSVSRYHAVIQYCQGDDTHPKGFYVYDLGSTHGTFLNKSRINFKVYYKLKVGYILKFGGSTRIHVFQGPEEEEELINNKTPEAQKSGDEPVCTWGMSEDAEEEDGSINPFALSTANEELYIDDPKKTLRGWFEREGYEVEYKVEEKGFRTFSCSVQLPVDTSAGDFLTVEASVNGKKREAVVACALEACRTLDRMGLLRQSHQESQQKKKKKWEENDYYDSDEDTFYDRTGEIEKRREMRKRLTQKTEVENYQSLETKLNAVNSEIEELTKKIDACNPKMQSSMESSEDSLESYMSSLSQAFNVTTDKFERRKMKLRLIEAEKERSHLEKLLDIARPVKLPPVAKHPGIVGKKLKSKLQLPLQKPKVDVKQEENKDREVVEEESDSEDETAALKPSNESIEQETENKDFEPPVDTKKYGLVFNPRNESDMVVESVTLPKESVVSDIIKNCSHDGDDKTSVAADDSKNDSEEMKPPVKRARKDNLKKLKKDFDVYEVGNDYCTWTPPANQSGDGITHLNAKYGY